MGDNNDDLHVCLKCHDQIVGLESYIEHRRSTCRGKPQEDTASASEAADCNNKDAPQSPDGEQGGDTSNKDVEPSHEVPTETEASPTAQGNDDDPPTLAKTSSQVGQHKRKRGRPRKVPQSTDFEVKDSISLGTRSSRTLKMKRHPSAAPKDGESPEGNEAKPERPMTRKRVRVPIRYVDNVDENDDSDYEPTSTKQTKKRGRKSTIVLTDEEKVAVTQYKVEKFYNCIACKYKTINLHGFLKHLKTVKHVEAVGSSNTDAVYSCKTCSLTFYTEKGLTKHSIRHEQLCKCSKCNIEFESRKDLQIHHKNEHGHQELAGSAGTVQPCKTCGKVLSRGYMKIHLRIHTGEKPFACDICPFRTNQQGDLKMHQKRHYGIKDHKCSLCTFVTVKASILKNHMKLHTKRERTEACHLCPQKFYNQGLLKSHIHLRHEPSRVHRCTFPGCTYKFKCRIDLVTHTRRHTNEKPFLCTVCGYSGSTKQALARHSRKHTGAKPFKCDYPGCSYMGRVSTHLTRHKRLHTGAKPYKCPYCSYRANTHENVRKHIRFTKKHAGLSVYVCKLCPDLHTDLYKELVDHMRKMHADDYVTFDQVSHQMGLLAEKEEAPVNLMERDMDQMPLPTKLSQELHLALEADKSSQGLLTSEDDGADMADMADGEMEEETGADDHGSEVAVPEAAKSPRLRLVSPATQVVVPVTKPNMCKEYILCRVIQDGGQAAQNQPGVSSEDANEPDNIQDTGEMQEIQMVTVEEGHASEAIEMILRQAVSGGSGGPQDYIIL